MKEGWEIKSIRDVAIVVAGQSPEGKFYNANKIGLPFYQGKKEFGDKYINPSGVWTSVITKIALAGDILMSVRAPVGPVNVSTEEICIGRGLAAIRKKDNVLNDFLYYFFKYYESKIKGNTGAVFDSINKSQIESIPFLLPPLPEQQRIVTIIDKAFEAIDKSIENTQKNLQNAKELFESYLNGVFEKGGEGWENCNLEKHIKLIDYRGRTPIKTSQGVRLITAKNVKLGFLQAEPEEFIDDNAYSSWMTRGIPTMGDVIFTTEAPLANVAQILTPEKLAFAQRIIVMHPNRDFLSPYFLKYMLMSYPIRKKILDNGTGATVTGIKSSVLKKISITFPTNLDEQDIIVKRLDAFHSNSQTLEHKYHQKLRNLEELKKSILNKAFAGEL